MVNLEHKLTIDDLIVEYLMYRIKNGYNPEFLTSDFIEFLRFFETKMEVEDTIYDGVPLFKRFFARKAAQDWSYDCPHMDMIYCVTDYDYIIRANYKFSAFDESVVNTYFMSKEMKTKIRKIIGEYLDNYPKLEIDETVIPNRNEFMIGKYVAAKIVAQIWGRYVEKYCNLGMWPAQCDDINKFLFEIDLAKVIGVPSIADELLELYTTFSKRIAILYHHDKNLMVSPYGNVFLAKSNYSLLIDGYEEIIANTLGYFREPLKFDLSLSSFANEYQITDAYDWSEERAVKFKLKVLENNENIRIVNGFDGIKK